VSELFKPTGAPRVGVLWESAHVLPWNEEPAMRILIVAVEPDRVGVRPEPDSSGVYWIDYETLAVLFRPVKVA
jgi:hypothetical protein